MTARKRVQAWAVVSADGRVMRVAVDRPGMVGAIVGDRAVKLVEHDPRAAKVLKTAVKLVGLYEGISHDHSSDEFKALSKAVEAWRKGRKP